jgi:PIN domain nuclease of toxin-antitoxin system
MSEVVLDASALLALLRDEPGAAKVADAIADDARMSSVNYAEVVSHFIHAGMPADQVDAMLRLLPMAVVAADHALADHRRAPARRDGRGRPVTWRPLLPWRLRGATAFPR